MKINRLKTNINNARLKAMLRRYGVELNLKRR